MTDGQTTEQNNERHQSDVDEARRRGLDSEAIVTEDAFDDSSTVKGIAERDHPHTDTAVKNENPENARMPPHPKHVWVFVLIVTIFGILLAWWGVSFN